jgi:hypothetical protein
MDPPLVSVAEVVMLHESGGGAVLERTSEAAFSWAFKREVGVSPGAWRREKRRGAAARDPVRLESPRKR